MFLYSKLLVQNDMDDIISRDYIPYDNLRDKTVLITGANGMLAYYFTCVLMHLNSRKSLNIKVIALVRNLEKAKMNFEGFLSSELFKLLPQDVCDPIEIDEDINYIIHAAGSASPKFIKCDPVGIILANTRGTINILEAAKMKNIDNILFLSTREIYGELQGISSIDESDMGILNPLDYRSCYPESKRMSENIFRSYYSQYNIPFTVARIAHSYGPGMEINQDGRVLSDFVSDVVNNRDILLKSTGLAERAFCYINDAIAGMFLILLKGKISEAYNIANEKEPIKIKDLAEKLVNLNKERNLKVIFDLNEDSSVYCQYIRVGLSTRKLEKLGWSATISLDEGLRKTIKSYEEI